MRSMTGSGRGETAAAGFRFVLELQSVNRKHLDIPLNLPRPLLHPQQGHSVSDLSTFRRW